MFENRQDTNLLRNSLISSSKCLKDIQINQGSCSLKDEGTAAQVVASTINSMTSNLYGINTFHELFHQQQNIKRRCHAVVFINLLKSQNISCPDADNFYQTNFLDVDNLNWSYYLQLNFLCNWSEYFIECAHQLQPDVLSVVLKKLLEPQYEGELKFYACHLALQASIRKTLEMPSSSVENSNAEVNFAFNFCLPHSYSDEEDGHKDEEFIIKNLAPEHLQPIFDIILKRLTNESDQKCDIYFIKVVLHGVKTVLKLVNNISTDEVAGSCVKKLNLLAPLFVQCLTGDTMVSAILQNMEKPFQCLVDSGYQIMSWEINELYLVFLLLNFLKDFKAKSVTSPESKLSLNTVSSYCSDFHTYMKQNDLSYKTLADLNEKYLNSCIKNKENYYLLLTVIVKHHYPYASRAAECLLSNPQLWEQYNVINLLEENITIFHPFELEITLADAIVKTKSKNMQDRLLSVFYKLLSQATNEIYNKTLENILKNWGFCEYFMTTNFDAQLTQLSRKTMTLKEIEETLLPLFVQSPKVVLQFLIEQAMMQGLDGMEALKVLKTIPIACVYECHEEPVAPLITILSPYFEHNLRANEAKHFVILLKTLMEMQVTEDILSFDSFLDKCIFPNSLIQSAQFNQLEFTLECLHVALDILISNDALEIGSDKYISLFKHLGTILCFCIENNLGKLKETVVDIMKLLSNHKKKPQLDALFNNENKDSKHQLFDVEKVLKLYIISIFYKETNPDQQTDLLKWKNEVIKENFHYLWIWCCITSDVDDFVDHLSFYGLSYVDFLKYLPTNFWHFTRSEWLQSTRIITFYQFYHLKTGSSNYPWLLPNNNPDVYSIIRCLIDVFTLMMKEKSLKDILYSSSCLTNTIMDLVKKTTKPSLLVNVFLDICCVSSYLDSEVFFMFSSVLMSLQKQCLSICEEADKKDYIMLMKLGINSIQNDVVDIESLKDKFCQL
ncbi:uncharacterized protein [Parasteatoda tepidariorum]|uniref:uncharacterized protein n=1 Tax=Parasteatoda tepidariorum TaxID=114398 RepID=UPI001C7267F8|nr:uncharacterized protein LOC107450508 [Parasteatoda tepidariorum]